MTQRLRIAWWGLLVSAALCVWVAGTAPYSAAQSPTSLSSLQIALWPEYDRPEVLVIYRGAIAPGVSLPAAVSLDLPATVPALNAVAYVDESSQSLVNLTDYRLTAAGTGKTLVLSTPAREFHVEYYAPDLLSRQDTVRSITFSFTASVAVADFGLEVQQPAKTTGFESTPAPDITETHGDGLSYAVYRLGSLAVGDARSVQITYRRSTDELSVAALESTGPAAPEPSAPQPMETAPQTLNLTVWLVALGALLIIGAAAYYVWQLRRGRPSQRGVGRSSGGAAPAGYCHRCGSPLRPDGSFCHVCGTPRRRG